MSAERKIVLITGATRGVGHAIATALAPTYHLLVGGRTGAEVERVVAEFPSAAPFVGDLTDPVQLAAAVATAPEVDVLIHNAGVSTYGPIAAVDAETWQRTLDINVVVPATLTRALLPTLRARDGHVVFLNSGAGQSAKANKGVYAASKHALRAVADALRAEEPDLRVTSVYPGRIDTEMQRELVAAENGEYDTSRYLTPQSVARVIADVLAAPADTHLTEITLRPRGE